MNSAAPISVLLVEDHNLLRIGIRVSILHDQSISIVGEATNGVEAVNQARSLNPDVILMDVSMPIMDGLESSREIKKFNSRSKIIMLTSHTTADIVQSAFSSGASGYCLKDVDAERLCSAIKAVHNGAVWMDQEIAGSVLNLCAPVSSSIIATSCSDEDSHTRAINSLGCDRLSEKYEQIGLLGQGGMSSVYSARHKVLNKIVAIKLLSKNTANTESFEARFVQEGRIMSQLSHENIVKIQDFGFTSRGTPYLVMDYEDGPSLADVLQTEKRIDEFRARKIFKQILAGLAHAHAHGIVHRDIKPGNIILSRQANGSTIVRILDFGLAKVTNPDTPPQSLTQSGLVFGSPLYMSPEQCRGEVVDSRTDVYSLGCLMYEVICGRPPFHGGTAIDTMAMHLSDKAKEPSSEICSDELRNIINKCLAKNPSERFSSLDELLKLM